jgi:hypothetical protein
MSPIITLTALRRALEVAQEYGGYDEVVLLDADDRPYEVVNVEMSGNYRPLVLRIELVENVKSN